MPKLRLTSQLGDFVATLRNVVAKLDKFLLEKLERTSRARCYRRNNKFPPRENSFQFPLDGSNPFLWLISTFTSAVPKRGMRSLLRDSQCEEIMQSFERRRPRRNHYISWTDETWRFFFFFSFHRVSASFSRSIYISNVLYRLSYVCHLTIAKYLSLLVMKREMRAAFRNDCSSLRTNDVLRTVRSSREVS